MVGLCLLAAACTGAPAPIKPGSDAAAIALAPTPTALPVKPKLEVRELPGLHDISERELVSRLGTPDFTRKEEAAEIWQYRSESCVLDVFLYPEDGVLKVAHVATRDRARLKAPENSCSPFSTSLTASAGT
ncbi:MAG TPA: hypothetical protein VM689_03215 [Aliidongia sp.]|nr:hypothetical protein [Aliidongia sp.]